MRQNVLHAIEIRVTFLRMRKRNENLHARIGVDLHRKVDRVADMTGTVRSDLIRAAVRYFVDLHPALRRRLLKESRWRSGD